MARALSRLMHIQIRPVMAAPPWHYYALFSTSLTIIFVTPTTSRLITISFSELSFCTKTIVSPPRHFFKICPQRFQALGAFGLKYAFLRPLSMTVCHAQHHETHCHEVPRHDMLSHAMSSHATCSLMSCTMLCCTSNLSTVLKLG